MVPNVSTPKKRSGRGRGRVTPRRKKAAAVETVAGAPAPDTPAAPVPEATEFPPTSVPEPVFASRVPPPAPERPRPATRRAIFFDVENSSRVEHIRRLLDHLRVDRLGQQTEVVAVGNWRVASAEAARMLARHGAHLVHSAPATGVRDWSDLRIAVTAGVWLAGARPGDTIEIITDDQAFDAVGDVAASLGVEFRRLSFRALAGVGEVPREEPRPRRAARRAAAAAPAPRWTGRSRRTGTTAAHRVAAAPAATNGGEPEEPHGAARRPARRGADVIMASRDRAVSLDALSNALKARGFRRTPGSPRLVTRLRRIKELEVTRSGQIRLVEGEGPEGVAEGPPAPESALATESVFAAESALAFETAPAPERVGTGDLTPDVDGAEAGDEEPTEEAAPEGAAAGQARRAGAAAADGPARAPRRRTRPAPRRALGRTRARASACGARTRRVRLHDATPLQGSARALRAASPLRTRGFLAYPARAAHPLLHEHRAAICRSALRARGTGRDGCRVSGAGPC
jgi:hypothetical protein